MIINVLNSIYFLTKIINVWEEKKKALDVENDEIELQLNNNNNKNHMFIYIDNLIDV